LVRDANILPPHCFYDYKIELILGSKIPYTKNRPLLPIELQVLKQWLDNNLA
jgi:hypothetical protein